VKEYLLEQKKVDLQPLEADLLPLDIYQEAHQALVIPCHDIMVWLEEEKGWLLVIRKNDPAKDILWPLGGRILRGIPTEESVRRKVQQESGLFAEDISFSAVARTYFQTDPFGHLKGTDTLNLWYNCKAKGKIQLDSLHEDPMIVRREDFTREFVSKLHPYVKDMFEEAWKWLGDFS
jgi:hypothetical protein